MKQIFSPKKPYLWILIALAVTAAVLCWLFIPRPVEVPSALDACVRSVLYEVHYSSHTEGKYPALAYTPLAVEEQGDSVTLYGVMMYREYTCTTENQLEVWGAAHYPFAITATSNADGTYTATDCWWPADGKNHISSIRKKFPAYCEGKAVKYSTFYTDHAEACGWEALENIADSEKYVVLESERENIRLAYCAETMTAYIHFGGGALLDGAYAPEGEKAVFTFGERKLVFSIDGEELVYSEAESENIPEVWKGVGDTEYFTDGVRFTLVAEETPPAAQDTAPVGPTFTAASTHWMEEEELREMFGEHVPSSFECGSLDNRYLPVRPIETRAQLERFVAAFADSWSDLKLENFAAYDEAFFEDNYVMVTYYLDGMDSCEPAVSSYTYVQEDTTLWLSVRLEVEKPAAGDTVVGQWLLFSGISKEDFKKANALEAYVENVVTVEETSADLTLTGTVKEVDGNAMLLECEDNSRFTTVWVELGDAELDPMVGEIYVVTYEDYVMPSLPPRIVAITITKP